MAYVHTVQYYETDMMGITHHSNYIRWMEEARTAFLKEIGCDYGEMEKSGIISPLMDVSCKYKRPTTYEDVVSIEVKVIQYTGVTCRISYKMTKQDGTLVCEGESGHCFANREGKPIRVKRERPDIDELFTRLAAAE